MSIIKHIITKSYLWGCLVSDCLPMTYDGHNMVISQQVGVVSACFIWSCI